MQPADAPLLPSRNFRPRVYGVGAWTDNLHFAYDVMAALRPRVFVELGTDRGESYFAFCQSAAENGIATRCYAVDTWQGDQQAGGYDETTFREVSTHNDSHYADFSTLLRCSFDDALRRFADESIDLLHLDGFHTEEAVRHDVEQWLPKLRPGGIFLMHDVSVQTRDFGVWRVWEKLRERGCSYTFRDGPGLGVWQKPPNLPLPSPLEDLLRNDAPSATQLLNYYRTSARQLQDQIAQHWRDGTIGETAAGNQTIVQLFHTHDGVHQADRFVQTRIGHDDWKDLMLELPRGAGAAPLRLDFVSPFTTIDLALIELSSAGENLIAMPNSTPFESLEIRGDARRLPHPAYLRLQITGPDPQLFFPPIDLARDADAQLFVKVRVTRGKPPD